MERPVLWTTEDLIDRAAERVANRREPFYSAWQKIQEHADAALDRAHEPYHGGDHRTYYRTGRAHAHDARHLALAYRVTGRKEYLDGARTVLCDWAEDAAENPDPAGDRDPPAGSPQGLVIGRAISIFCDCYGIVFDDLRSDERDAIRRWFELMVDPIMRSRNFWIEGEDLPEHPAPYLDQQYFNNHLSAQNLGLTAIGFAIDDRELVRYAIDDPENPRNLEALIDGVIVTSRDDLWKDDPTLTEDAPDPVPGETYDRYRIVSDKGLHYSNLQVRLLSLMAEIAYNNDYGQNYYRYVGPDGENLELSYEFYADFLITGDSAAHTGYYEGSAVDFNMIALYELGHRHYPDNEKIREVLDSRSREIFDTETFGWTAVLTHGENGVH